MYIDPVVQEIRRNGARIAEDCGGDVHRMAERLRQEQQKHPERLIRRSSSKQTPLPSPEKGTDTTCDQ